MNFNITYTDKARSQLALVKNNPSLEKRYKAVVKTLAIMSVNLRHPSLNTHEYSLLSREMGRKVFESYAEYHTAGAYRIFWTHGEAKGEIQVIAITPHP